MQSNGYGRRRHFENVLVEATSKLPDRCGISRQRLQQLRIIFNRKIPAGESAVAVDDMRRRKAVLELVQARVQAGYESPGQIAKWKYIVDMERQARITLWQQREFVVATLKKRNDNKEISQSAPSSHSHGLPYQVLHRPYELMNVSLIESANTGLNDSAALRRLLKETLKEVDHGGIERGKIGMLQSAFSSSNGGSSELSRQKRRDALIYILRARRRAGIQERPELNNEWGLMELLPLIGLTRKELDEHVEMDDVNTSIETDGELTAFSLSH